MSPEQERFGFLEQKQFLRSSPNHCGIAKFSFNCMCFNFTFDCGTESSEVNSKQPLPGIRCYEMRRDLVPVAENLQLGGLRFEAEGPDAKS